MNLTPQQAAGSVHAKKVEYSLESFPQHKIILNQKFAGDMLGGCTWRGAALLARLVLFSPAMDYIEKKHFLMQKRYLSAENSIIDDETSTTRRASSSCGVQNIFTSCIELGSGAGLVSLAAAASGRFSSKILATEDDDYEIISLLEKNIRENFVNKDGAVRSILLNSSTKKLPVVACIPLPWGKMDLSPSQLSQVSPLHGGNYFDVILCSEVLYDPELVDPLLATILALCGQNANPKTGLYSTVILTNDTRAGDAAMDFLTKASKYFTVERWSVDGDDKELTKDLMTNFCPDWFPLKSSEEGIFVMQRRGEVKDFRSQVSKFEKQK